MSNVLILLIGGNPLPNYVTAKYMLDETRNDKEFLPVPDKFILLHSNTTIKYAQKIKEKMRLSGYDPFANLGDNERSRKTIIEAVINKLNKLQNKCAITSIHLNYTGGTKPMAVHTYNGIIDFCDICKKEENKIVKPIFSYLDPVQFKLVLDESGNGYPNEMGTDLRDKVKLQIEDLFDIHVMKYEKKGDLATFKDNELDIRKFSGDILKSFEGRDPVWPVKFFILKEKKKKVRIDGIKDLNEQFFFQGINEDIPSLSHFFKNDKFDLELQEAEKTFTELTKFMSGIWLEDFIVDIIKGLKKENKIAYDEIYKSVHATYNKRELEVDIIVMKGYQMFLFSCTTYERAGEVKGKAFEAIFRAEQLGGDHATAITVSCIKNVDLVVNDLKSFGDLQERYKLIGLQDLMNIKELEENLTLIIGK